MRVKIYKKMCEVALVILCFIHLDPKYAHELCILHFQRAYELCRLTSPMIASLKISDKTRFYKIKNRHWVVLHQQSAIVLIIFRMFKMRIFSVESIKMWPHIWQELICTSKWTDCLEFKHKPSTRHASEFDILPINHLGK